MSRRTALKLIAQTLKGKRFVLNFAYCEKRGLFAPGVNRPAILDELASAIDRPMPEDVMFTLMGSCMQSLYHASGLFSGLPGTSKPLFRITTLSRFLATSFPILSSTTVTNYGYLREDGTTSDQLHQFAEDVLRAGSIVTGAKISGRHPFAWVTDALSFAMAMTPAPGDENAVGRRLCKELALDGFEDRDGLFLMQYPSHVTAYRVRRPTACDGIGNLYFKARSCYDTHSVAESGYTIDLAMLDANPVVRPPYTDYDGLPEYAVEAAMLTEEFSLCFVGFYDPAWTTSVPNLVDEIIAGAPDHDQAMLDAIDFLANL